MTPQALVERGVISQAALDIFLKDERPAETLGFDMIVPLYIMHKALESGEITLDEARLLSQSLKEHFARFEGKDFTLLFLRKQGIASCCLVSAPADIIFEAGTKVVSRVTASSCIEELKMKLS
jgi:hypothetical protein